MLHVVVDVVKSLKLYVVVVVDVVVKSLMLYVVVD